jgi:23S rRNA pseudouridine2605 synthase
VSGKPAPEAISRLRSGVSISTDEGRRVKTAPAKIRLVRDAENPWYEITLIEGRNRQIRRMFEEVGHHVEKIRRVRYGPLALDVEPGRFRSLTRQEIARLKAAPPPLSARKLKV